MNNYKILAVNDAPDQLELLAFILGQAGYQVISTSSSIEGLKIARRELPNLIISDFIMPDMDGIEFCRKVRADNKLRSIPFLLVSALRKDNESVVEGLEVGVDDYIEVPYEPMRLVAKAAQFIERKRMEDALRESENRFRSLIENLTDIISILAPDGTILYESPSLENVLGYKPEEMIGRNAFDFIHSEDAPDIAGYFKLAVVGLEKASSIEYRFRHKDNSWRILESVGKPFTDPNNELVAIVTSRDITERKQSEVALRQGEERYRNFIEKSTEGIWRIEFNEPIPIDIPVDNMIELAGQYGFYAQCNDAMAQMYGFESAKDLIGKPFSELFILSDSANREFIHAFMENGFRMTDAESHELDAHGENKYFLNNLVGIVDSGKLTGVWGTQRDITRQMAADTALRESENRFQLVSRATSDALWDWNLATNSVWYSEGYYKLFGCSPDEVEPNINLWYEAIHPEDKERVISKTQAVIEKGDNYWIDEYRLRSADGSDAYIFDRGYIVYGDDGKPVRMIGAAVNITDRKQTEQVSQANQARLEKQNKVLNELTKHHKLFHEPLQAAVREITEISAQILETERVSVWLYDDDKSKIRAIDLYELSSNIHSEGVELEKLDYPKYFEVLAKDMGIAAHDARTDSRTGEFSESYLKPLGITSMLDAPIRIGGQVVGVVCHEHIGTPREWKLDEQNFAGSMASLVSLLLEANERRQAEDALRESQEHLALAQQVARIGSFEFNLQTRQIISSAALESLYGSPPGGLSGKYEDWAKYVHPEDLSKTEWEMEQLLSSGEHNSEFRILLEDGSLRWICSKGKVFYDDKGAPMRLVGVNMDVTERKKAEDAIRFQAHLLDTVEQAVIATNLDGTVIYWNRFAHQLYGWTSAEAVGQDIRELTTPKIAQEQAAKIMSQLGIGKSWAGEFTVNNKEGKTFPAQIFNSPVNDGEGKLIGIVGISIDITERKEAETALAEANRRAIREYDRLLQRLALLAQTLGTARDLTTVFRAILDFAVASVPCSTLFISLYDKEQSARKGIYMWYGGKEMDISNLEPIKVGEGPVGQAIKSGEVTVFNDYWKTAGKKPTHVYLGYEEDAREPHSTIIAPMKTKGNPVGVIEVQSYEENAYRQEHATAMRLAANLAANAIENVQLLEQERQNAEQLRQSQKLESVGRLAGGIAHDFNNMLTAINGYSDLTLRRLSKDDPLRRHIEEIKKAGERSAALTHQLLAFSRQQVLKPKVLNLNEVIIDTGNMLQRLIGEDIQLDIVPNSRLGLIEADPGQLTQVILNLAVNARDAMPQGGNLVIETDNVYLDEEYVKNHIPTRTGSYVLLAVSDTGMGIDDKTQRHIFEPFYTTKEMGKGTGLGLATVYGIVKQSGGYIWVYSEVGKGTTFKVYLPRVDEKVVSFEENNEPAIDINGTETILLVEDEDMVRNLSRQVLESCGYKVIEASNGIEALSICESQDQKIDLLLTDVVMPQMGGRELAEKLARMHPHIRLLYTSGYTDDAIIRQGIITEDMNFIQKPFTFEALAKKIRELMDKRNES